MSKPYLQLGGGQWAAKDGKILGFAQGDTSGKYLAREFSFTRGDDNDTTRVTKDGLIEKHRENLVTKSNVFGTADSNWTKAGIASVQAGHSGYDGTNDAWKVTSVASASGARVYKTQNAVTEIETWSIHVKAGNVNWCRLNMSNSGNVYFDLENGAVGTATADVFGAIEDKGGGWYRCSMTATPNATNHAGVFVFLADEDGTLTTAADKYIYIQDAQLEAGLVATEYLESGSTTAKAGISEDLPRIDYTNDTAQFILEPQRTNLIPSSEYLESWSFSGNFGSVYSFTQNHSISPDGTKNASRYSATVNYRSIRKMLTLETSTDYVFSFYVKNIDATRARYRVYNASTGYEGDVISSTSYFSSVSDSEWTRIEVPFTTDANGTSYGVYLADGLTVTNSGDSGGDILFWGAQVEKGPCATSYIPTHGATATRTAEGRNLADLKVELPSKLSLAYTLFVDFEVEANESTSDYQDVLYFGELADGTKEAVKIETFSDGDEESIRVFVYKADGTTQATSTGNASGSRIEFGTRAKVAVRVDDSAGVKVFYNGSSIKSLDTAQGYSHVKYIMATEADGSIRSKTLINSIRTYSEALTDTECENLTKI